MQGSLRTQGRPALVTLRLAADDIPSEAEVTVADVMLQPGGSSSGWLPHVTEMPWSAGITEDEETSTVYSRLNALESEMSQVRTDIEPITVAGDIWRGESISWDDHIRAEWHPEYGWISWIDLDGLADDGVTGDVELHLEETGPNASTEKAIRWGTTILTEQVSGTQSISARLDVLDDEGEKVDDVGVTDVEVRENWSTQIQQDLALPADSSVQPRVVIEGLVSEASGRIGISGAWVRSHHGDTESVAELQAELEAMQARVESIEEFAARAEEGTGRRNITDLFPGISTSYSISIERRGPLVALYVIAVDFGEGRYDESGVIPEGFRPSSTYYATVADGISSPSLGLLTVWSSGRFRISGPDGTFRLSAVWVTDDDWPDALPGEPA